MSVPYTIEAMIAQMGGRGLQGAFVYVGAHQITYGFPSNGDRRMEWRSEFMSEETPEGLVRRDVAVEFGVNGKPDEDWTMFVCYEPIDVYSVWLWRKASPTEAAAGKRGVVLDHCENVFCDILQEVVERMYDTAIEKHCNGFIPC